MKLIKTLLAGSVAALAVAAVAAPSQAAEMVQIWQNIGTDAVPVLVALTPATVGSNSYDGTVAGGLFSINILSGGVTNSPLFSSNDIDFTSNGAGTLDLFISVTGLTAPESATEHFHTVITSNAIPAGWSVTEQAWLNTADVPGTGTTLGFLSFTSDGQNGQSGTTDNILSTLPTVDGDFAISTEYKITTTGPASSSVNNTIDVFAKGVPEPSTWALMLVGFGGMGALLRSRRRSAAVAA